MVHNQNNFSSKSSRSSRDISRSKTNKKVTNNKRKLRKAFVIIGLTIILLIFLSGGVMAGLFVAGIQNTPDFDPEKMHSSLPSEILDKNGELITRLDREQYRVEVPLESIPEHTQQAFLAIEDVNFYDHRGYDPRGIIRAATTNIRTTGNPFRGPQGGSTITQQLVKNAFLSPQQHLERKIQELWLALQVERLYTKDEIFEFYLNNSVYFNHNAYGIQAGSQIYFDKDVEDLTIEESALLAGIIQHPSQLSPYNNSDQAEQRQEIVLNAMKSYDFITETEFNQALKTELSDILANLSERKHPYPYFVDYVINEELIPVLMEYSGLDDVDEARIQAENLLYRGGLTVHTTMDRHMQSQAERVVNDQNNYPTTISDGSGVTQPQAAVVLSHPQTGELRAVVGGRDYGTDNMFNRTLSSRQPGSVLKPINIYAPAIENNLISPGSVLDDTPTVLEIPGTNQIYAPENFNRNFSGLVTARTALTRSLNVPAVQLYVNELGMNKATQATRDFGITTFTENDERNPASAIGGWDHGAKPIEVNAAFATLANGGIRAEPHSIKQVFDRNDELIYESNPSMSEIVSEQTSWLVTDMLTDVVNWGTASAVDLGRPAAGKTGTSQNQRDGWLSTYTPDLSMTVWIGYDRDQGTGSAISNPWQYTTSMVNQVMKPVLEGQEIRDFSRPSGITGPLAISSKSGLIPSDLTPEEYISYDYFKPGMVPTGEDNAFVEVEICLLSDNLATDSCDDENVETQVFLRKRDYQKTDDRWNGTNGRVPGDADLMAPRENCDLHESEDMVSPYQLSVVYSEKEDIIKIIWDKTDENFEKFNIYKQKPDQTDFILIQEYYDKTEYQDLEIEEGEKYSYRIVGIKENEEAPFSETRSISTDTESLEDKESQDKQNDEEQDIDDKEDEGQEKEDEKEKEKEKEKEEANNGKEEEKEEEGEGEEEQSDSSSEVNSN